MFCKIANMSEEREKEYYKAVMVSQKDKKTYACPTCDKTFETEAYLHLHYSKAWKFNMCHKCGISFQSVRMWKLHTKSHFIRTSYECELCDKTFAHKSGWYRHMHRHSGRKYTCPTCDKNFTLPNLLLEHMTIHTGEKLYSCEICGWKFRFRSSWQKHTKEKHKATLARNYLKSKKKIDSNSSIHGTTKSNATADNVQENGKILNSHFHKNSRSLSNIPPRKKKEGPGSACKPHRCDTCHKVFRGWINFGIHIRKCHTKETFHKCDTCLKTFETFSSLQDHILTHIGDNNIPHRKRRMSDGGKLRRCRKCHKLFKWKSTLRIHMLSHKRKPIHKCDTCCKTFKKFSSLQEHIVSHIEGFSGRRREKRISIGRKLHSCQRCHKLFKEKSTLRIHMQSHLKKPVYKCDTCRKTFKKLSILQEHIPTHIEENQHSCGICNNIFEFKSDLREHMLCHTWENAPNLPNIF